jgi:hypothetical protein
MELEPQSEPLGRLMPIRAYLDGQKFDGETIRQMGVAFLDLTMENKPTALAR